MDKSFLVLVVRLTVSVNISVTFRAIRSETDYKWYMHLSDSLHLMYQGHCKG